MPYFVNENRNKTLGEQDESWSRGFERSALSVIGSFGGGLSGIEPGELGGQVMKEAVARSGVDAADINYVTVGNCIPNRLTFCLCRPCGRN